MHTAAADGVLLCELLLGDTHGPSLTKLLTVRAGRDDRRRDRRLWRDDDNPPPPPAPTTAQIRAIHASANTPAVDVFVNGTQISQGTAGWPANRLCHSTFRPDKGSRSPARARRLRLHPSTFRYAELHAALHGGRSRRLDPDLRARATAGGSYRRRRGTAGKRQREVARGARRARSRPGRCVPQRRRGKRCPAAPTFANLTFLP